MNFAMKRRPLKESLIFKEDKIIANEPLKIEFPTWYENKKLVEYGETTSLYGIFAIINSKDEYSVSRIPTMIQTTPLLINKVNREDGEYYQFLYSKNSVICDRKVVKMELLSYNFFEAFIISAKVPWFIKYEDLLFIINNLEKYSKSELGKNHISSELVVSFITRVKNNLNKFYRQDTKSEYTFIDLNNVYYSSISTISKIAGNYFTEGLISALVQKEEEPIKLEEVVRK